MSPTKPRNNLRRTKIVATWGPALAAPERLDAVIRAGVDVFRLNFSHSTHEEFARAIPEIRRAAENAGRTVALLQAIQGPRIRTGLIDGTAPVELVVGSTVNLSPGEAF